METLCKNNLLQKELSVSWRKLVKCYTDVVTRNTSLHTCTHSAHTTVYSHFQEWWLIM